MPQGDKRAAEARANMKDRGVSVKDDNNTIDVSGDKHDITKQDSYVRDVNSRVAGASSAEGIQAEIDSVKNTLTNGSRDELEKIWPPKR